MIETWNQALEQLREKFLGKRARLYLFTVTHSTAVIEIWAGGTTSVFIVLTGCTTIHMPSSWVFAIPSVTAVEGESGLHRLSSPEAEVVLEFEYLAVEDWYPPVGRLS